MSDVTVTEAVVLPLVVIEIVILVAGGLFFGVLSKNALTCGSSDEKNLMREADSQVLCCKSPVHAFAVSYFVFFVIFCLSNLLVTSIVNPNVNPTSCGLSFIFGSFSFVGAKGSQYGFFTMRMRFVFEDTTLRVPDWTMKKLLGVIAFYFLASIIVYILMAAFTLGSSSSVVRAGTYEVCIIVQGEFHILSTIASMIFIISDVYIMVSVVYGFVSRLLTMSGMTKSNRVLLRTVGLAYKSLLLFLVTVTSSLAMIVVIAVYPHNLGASFGPHVDNFLNAMCIFATFQFGDWLYRATCSKCTCYVSTIVVCCCAKNDPNLREALDEARNLQDFPVTDVPRVHVAATVSGEGSSGAASPREKSLSPISQTPTVTI